MKKLIIPKASLLSNSVVGAFLSDATTVTGLTNGTEYAAINVDGFSEFIPNIVGGGSQLPTPFLLESFESLTGFSVTNSTQGLNPVQKVQGTNSLKLSGTGASTGPITSKLSAVNKVPADLGVIARYIYNHQNHGFGTSGIQFANAGGAYSTMTNGVSAVTLTEKRKGYWAAFHYTEEPTIAALAAVTDIRVRNALNSPYSAELSVDALYCNAGGKTNIAFTFDDNHNTTHDIAFPLMQARGLVGTCYVVPNWLDDGNPARVTSAQLQTLQAAGWLIGLDGTNDDTAMTTRADVATIISEYQAAQALLATKGLDDGKGKNHTCYPGGIFNTAATGQNVASVTANGSTSVTLGTASTVQNGWTVYGKNVPSGTVVVSGGGSGVTALVLSNNIPAQTLPMYFRDETTPFCNRKIQDAFLAIGVKTGRTIVEETFFTRFGLDDQTMLWPSYATSGKTIDQLKAAVDLAILRGSNINFITHRLVDTTQAIHTTTTVMTQLFDYVQSKIAAGQAECMHIDALYEKYKTASVPS